MTITQLIDHIEKQGHVRMTDIIIEACNGGYYSLIRKNQEQLVRVIEEHNKAIHDKIITE